MAEVGVFWMGDEQTLDQAVCENQIALATLYLFTLIFICPHLSAILSFDDDKRECIAKLRRRMI